MYVLRQKSVTVAHPKRIDKQIAGLILPANLPQCIDQPEPANQKLRLRKAKIVGGDISHNVVAASKFTVDRLDGGHEPRIIGLYQAKFGQQQCAGIKILALKRSGKRLAFGIPGTLEHLLSNAVGDLTPICRTFG